MSLVQLLAERRHILLDFDGPVCAVFPGRGSQAAADAVRRALGAAEWRKILPDRVGYSEDPFDVLRYASDRLDREKAEQAEKALTQYEIASVRQVPPTLGALDAIATLRATGHTITIVSNNSEAAIGEFIERYGLGPDVDGIAARAGFQARRLKPEPCLLYQAIEQLGAKPGECVLVGDSITDIQAARAADVAVIAFANKPGKDRALRSFEPDAVIASMSELDTAARMKHQSQVD
ncbi:HAD family hydrolase [Pseudonocardia bannensis]|nr:HAD family hydrolase [Pseudonocardia bannensis]